MTPITNVPALALFPSNITLSANIQLERYYQRFCFSYMFGIYDFLCSIHSNLQIGNSTPHPITQDSLVVHFTHKQIFIHDPNYKRNSFSVIPMKHYPIR